MLKNHENVGLESLVDFCWGDGIPIIHVKILPQESKKLDGMALFSEG